MNPCLWKIYKSEKLYR